MPKNPQKWQTLAHINKHPRDERIEFDEPTHKYTIDDTNESKMNEQNLENLEFNHVDNTVEKKNLDEVKSISGVRIADQKIFKTNIMIQSKNKIKLPNIKY